MKKKMMDTCSQDKLMTFLFLQIRVLVRKIAVISKITGLKPMFGDYYRKIPVKSLQT